jgi:hypothetical protein
MDLSALTELFGNLAGFFGGFKDVFSGLGAIFENGAALSSGVLVFRESGAFPAAGLEDLISQVQQLDMDEIRKEIAEAQAAEGQQN